MTVQPGIVGAKDDQKSFSLGLDAWAVVLALILALLVGIGVIKHVPW